MSAITHRYLVTIHDTGNITNQAENVRIILTSPDHILPAERVEVVAADEAVRDAAYAALVYLANATTEDFGQGSDRAVRRQLVEALGYDWTEYDRGNVKIDW